MNSNADIVKISNMMKSRRGTYILEAVMVIPIFIIAVVMLISVIPMIGTCENIAFAAADEMRIEAIKTSVRKNPAAMPVALDIRIKKENNSISSLSTWRYRYLYSECGIDDLISMDIRAELKQNNPMDMISAMDFRGRLVGRAYTGSVHKDEDMAREEFEEEKDSCKVWVFPEYGEKYHKESCTYVQASCHMEYLSQSIIAHYRPCPLCGAGKLSLGMPVFCFSKDGEAYHTGDCKQVKRYVVVMEKEDAERKGYEPCSKCGG